MSPLIFAIYRLNDFISSFLMSPSFSPLSMHISPHFLLEPSTISDPQHPRLDTVLQSSPPASAMSCPSHTVFQFTHTNAKTFQTVIYSQYCWPVLPHHPFLLTYQLCLLQVDSNATQEWFIATVLILSLLFYCWIDGQSSSQDIF